jgi:hypothetical protein
MRAALRRRTACYDRSHKVREEEPWLPGNLRSLSSCVRKVAAENHHVAGLLTFSRSERRRRPDHRGVARRRALCRSGDPDPARARRTAGIRAGAAGAAPRELGSSKWPRCPCRDRRPAGGPVRWCDDHGPRAGPASRRGAETRDEPAREGEVLALPIGNAGDLAKGRGDAPERRAGNRRSPGQWPAAAGSGRAESRRFSCSSNSRGSPFRRC